jgi:hypothetical protein
LAMRVVNLKLLHLVYGKGTTFSFVTHQSTRRFAQVFSASFINPSAPNQPKCAELGAGPKSEQSRDRYIAVVAAASGILHGSELQLSSAGFAAEQIAIHERLRMRTILIRVLDQIEALRFLSSTESLFPSQCNQIPSRTP